ncbi:chemotaxis protein CheA [Paracoccus jiaweipingae]|uniref:chemotaxis protein CheA n=1 Tax=unclassified Paracoccus (in: a-proteobacteria) TaxID=2688777 RepID=UPI0037A48507
MTDPMAEIKVSFFIECDELLEGLQDGLTVLQDSPEDDDTINAVFRAVHSIKGGAGAFGLDALVGFAHRFETALDALRSGKAEVTPDLVALLFRGADLLQDHVIAARDDSASPEGAESLLQDLEAQLGICAETEEPEEISFQPSGLSLDLDFGGMDDDPAPLAEGPGGWMIRFRPLPGFYESGNEAQNQLRALCKLGPALVTCHPPQLSLDPDQCEVPRLEWQIRLGGQVSSEQIEAIFDFVIDVCELDISPADPPDGPDGLREPQEISAGQDLTIEKPPAPDEDASAQICEQPVQMCETDQAEADVDGPAPDHPTTATPPRPVADAAKAPAKPAGDASAARPASATVRVDLERIDRLVNLVGELVINQAMLAQSVTDAGMDATPAVVHGLDEFMNLTRDIQDSVMMIRAQPVKSLFQRMSRIVREASAAVGKDVRLVTKGENTEIDKTVIERLLDPLTHMIRNAVDHGLESPTDRQKTEKNPTGTITLSASHRAGRVLIEIRDDGQGINRERVFNIAVQRGLIDPDAQLTESEIDGLLFLPGFSTASEVSALSGRGVGMDVVKSAITSIGGKISISSERGKGTSFLISLPLTLAVLDGMVIKAADQTLVLPISSIVETSTLADHKQERVGPSTTVIRLRGEILPLIDLADSLGFIRHNRQSAPGIVLLTSSDDGNRRAFIVDSILDQRQVVIKGLGDHFTHIPGVSGATILGDGQIALILDPSDLTPANSARRPKNHMLAGECA